MIKKTLAILSSIVLLSACGTVAESKEQERFNVNYQNDDLNIVEDTKSGCKYILYSDYQYGGGITPLLKSNGKPDCPEVGEE